MKSLSILIPNRFTWDAIILTIESIKKRTIYPDYKIIVSDNSMSPLCRGVEPEPENKLRDNGSRIGYLREQAKKGRIQLIENHDQERKYGHGENIKKLLSICDTEYALLFVSTAEVLDPYWLHVLTRLIQTDRDLGVARFKSGGKQRELNWIAPVYWPNIMLLNMPLYRQFQAPGDWDLRRILKSEWKYGHIFNQFSPLREPENGKERVFLDTGSRLWERLTFENPAGYRILPLPDAYWKKHIVLYDGIDRNSHRPDHPWVQDRLRAVNERLSLLRGQ